MLTNDPTNSRVKKVVKKMSPSSSQIDETWIAICHQQVHYDRDRPFKKTLVYLKLASGSGCGTVIDRLICLPLFSLSQ